MFVPVSVYRHMCFRVCLWVCITTILVLSLSCKCETLVCETKTSQRFKTWLCQVLIQHFPKLPIIESSKQTEKVKEGNKQTNKRFAHYVESLYINPEAIRQILKWIYLAFCVYGLALSKSFISSSSYRSHCAF